MENQTDFAQGQQQGQMGREQQAFQQQAQQGQQDQQQGRGRGALVALAVIGLLVGIGGAGFGVYGMMQKADKPANLAVKIEKADGSTVELETDKIKKSEDGATITISDSMNTPEKYIYLDGYDLGLKIPSDSKLKAIQYEYRRFNAGPYSTLAINGVTENKIGAQAVPGFVAVGGVDTDIKPLAFVVICDKNAKFDEWSDCNGDDYVYSNDAIKIYYVGPQQVGSTDSEEAKWEVETVNAIKEWVSNKDNYIKL